MLNRHKVFEQLQHKVPEFFKHTEKELEAARIVWEKLCADPELLAKVLASGQTAGPLPHVTGALNYTVLVQPQPHPYQVVSTDGSQIYPDRHQGINCYLLNIGTVQFRYMSCSPTELSPPVGKQNFDEAGSVANRARQETSTTCFNSEPFLFTQDLAAHEQTPDLIDCHRTELEFKMGLSATQRARAQDIQSPLLFLCDGSLIFWHLEHKDPAVKQKFVGSYVQLLEGFYREKLLIAGFISMPKSKELVNILRAAQAFIDPAVQVEINASSGREALRSLGEVGRAAQSITPFDYITDTDIAHFFLPVNSRTGIFGNKAPITQLYPPHLKPHFFYLRLPDEIVRVEIPAWIAQDAQAINTVSSIILDQAHKGYGYPVALSEAHEQAVVKHIDREIFYQLIYTVTQTAHKPYLVSQKSLKKRLVGI